MKVTIYGAGKRGEYVAQKIQESKNAKIRVTLFIDNDSVYLNKHKFGVPIVSVDEFKKNLCGDEIVIVAAEIFTAQGMVVSLLNKQFNNIYIVPGEVFEGKLPILNKNGYLMKYIRHIKYYKPCLPYLEYHVTDFCNLKCKGCGHFSNIVKSKEFSNIDDFRKSLYGLSKKFSNIKVIRLMGGEPFLNLNLDLFIYEAKKAFPYSDIRIVTNGLIMEKISKNIVNTIRECNAVIDISQYPPTRDRIEKILCFAQENHVKINIGSEINEFFAVLRSMPNDNAENIEKTFYDCISKSCFFLRNKRLYPCPSAILLYENKDFLKYEIAKKDVIENSFDLLDGCENGWDILGKFLYPNNFCKYCTDKRMFSWCVTGQEAKREDWMVNNNEI